MNNTCYKCQSDVITQWEMCRKFWVSTSYCTRCGEKTKAVWESTDPKVFKSVPVNAVIFPVSEPKDDFDNRIAITYRYDNEGESTEFEVSYRMKRRLTKKDLDYTEGILEDILLHDSQLRKAVARYFSENHTTLSTEIDNIMIDFKMDRLLMEGDQDEELF